MLKTVGKDKIHYNNIDYDKDGWIDAQDCLPAKFDLVTMKTQAKKISGWHTGKDWFGLRLRDYDSVLYWKKKNVVY